jgi:hypothetical protein
VSAVIHSDSSTACFSHNAFCFHLLGLAGDDRPSVVASATSRISMVETEKQGRQVQRKKNMFDFFAKSRYTLYSQIQHSFWQVVDIDSAPPDWVGTGLQYRLLKCVAQFFWWKECCTMPGDSEHQGEWGSEEDQNLAANWRSIMHCDWSRTEQSIRLLYQVSIFSVVSWYWWGFLAGALPRP